jgi:glycogen debranching enzyme
MAPRQPLLHDLAVTLRAPTVCLSAPDGQLRGSGTQGVLCADVRVLARAVVTVDGAEPEPIGHGVTSASTEQFIGILRGVGVPRADPTVWLRRDRTVLADGLRETFTLVNRSDEAISVELRLDLDTDLAPIETIKCGEPVPTAPPGVTVQISAPDAVPPAARETEPVIGPTASAAFDAASAPAASGSASAPATSDATSAFAASAPAASAPAASAPAAFAAAPDASVAYRRVLRWPLTVPAGAEASRSWSLSVHDSGAVVVPANTRLPRPHTVRADDPRLAALLDRALADLDALLLTEPGHPGDVFAGAGAPWYLTLFGRDSLWTATLLLPYDVGLAAGTLRTLARTQGRATDPETGEEPGKILHERRRTATPFAERLPPLYYGTIDATPLWICLLRDAWRWGLPAEEVRALLPNLEAALGWIGRHGDRFVAYHNPAGRGLPNQGWKDSTDAVRFADGRQAIDPIALVEVQGYVHEAALAGAELLEAFDRPGAASWRAYAADLADRFRARFWVADADGPFPALALDGTGTGVDAPTSNIGHVLGTGLLDDAESALVAARIRDLADGYGVRTMAARAAGYSPLSYHCGSVWPHDTAIVARGLSRAGHPAAAAELARQLLAAAAAFDGRLPELFAGFGADEVAAPVACPASCRPQAWSAAAAVELLRVVLGLTVDVPAGVVTLRPPTPSPVGALEVRGLPVGAGHLDVAIDRDGRVTRADAPPGFRVLTPGGG